VGKPTICQNVKVGGLYSQDSKSKILLEEKGQFVFQKI
jgi:hypothetical protein